MVSMIEFRTLIEYRGNLTLFTDLDNLITWLWGKPLDNVGFWFGECPVWSLTGMEGHADLVIIKMMLPIAQVLAERYRTLLPVDLGVRDVSKANRLHLMLMPDDVHWLLRVGLDDGEKRPLDQDSILEFSINEGSACPRWFWEPRTLKIASDSRSIYSPTRFYCLAPM